MAAGDPSAYLSLNEMANSDLCHDRNRDRFHDGLDHPWVTLSNVCQLQDYPKLESLHHSRNPTLAADICRHTLQCHDCTSPSLFGYASLMKSSFILLEREGSLPYLFGVYNIHDHPTLKQSVRTCHPEEESARRTLSI